MGTRDSDSPVPSERDRAPSRAALYTFIALAIAIAPWLTYALRSRMETPTLLACAIITPVVAWIPFIWIARRALRSTAKRKLAMKLTLTLAFIVCIGQMLGFLWFVIGWTVYELARTS